MVVALTLRKGMDACVDMLRTPACAQALERALAPPVPVEWRVRFGHLVHASDCFNEEPADKRPRSA